MKWRSALTENPQSHIFVKIEGGSAEPILNLPTDAIAWMEAYILESDRRIEETGTPEVKTALANLRELSKKFGTDRPNFAGFAVLHAITFIEPPKTSIFLLDLPPRLQHALIWSDIYFIEQLEEALQKKTFTEEDIHPQVPSGANRPRDFETIKESLTRSQKELQQEDNR